MTGDIVNLRRHRKRKQRDEQTALAAENRMKSGRTKANKELVKAQSQLSESRLTAHRRDTEEPEA